MSFKDLDLLVARHSHCNMVTACPSIWIFSVNCSVRKMKS